MSRSLSRFAVGGGLGLAVVALGHEIVYVVAHGPGAGYATAMHEGGHDGYWSPYVILVTLIVAGLAGIASRQLFLLGRLAARRDSTVVLGFDARSRPFRTELLSLWLRLAALAVLAYLVQENLEIAVGGGEPPGLAVLALHDGLAVPVLLGTSLVVAAIGALVRWRRAILLWRIDAARRTVPRRAPTARPLVALARAPDPIVGRRNGIRGPPLDRPLPA
jgi:hypothetical protein